MPLYILVKVKLKADKKTDFIEQHMPVLKQAVEQRFGWEFVIALQNDSAESMELMNLWKLENMQAFENFEQCYEELSDVMRDTDLCIEHEDVQFMQALPYSKQMFL